jgi:hypothetical protein
MEQIKTIRRNLALKEYEIKETPSGKHFIRSIKLVKKAGLLLVYFHSIH